MTEIVEISAAYETQIRATVKRDLRTNRNSVEIIEPNPRKSPAFRNRAVILDAALGTASNAKTAPTSCLATVLRWDPAAGEYVETALQITVFNHSESTSYAANTFGAAIPIDGHFWFFGDCAAMATPGRGLPPEDPL